MLDASTDDPGDFCNLFANDAGTVDNTIIQRCRFCDYLPKRGMDLATANAKDMYSLEFLTPEN